jgi:hypothetical protein
MISEVLKAADVTNNASDTELVAEAGEVEVGDVWMSDPGAAVAVVDKVSAIVDHMVSS